MNMNKFSARQSACARRAVEISGMHGSLAKLKHDRKHSKSKVEFFQLSVNIEYFQDELKKVVAYQISEKNLMWTQVLKQRSTKEYTMKMNARRKTSAARLEARIAAGLPVGAEAAAQAQLERTRVAVQIPEQAYVAAK